MYKYKLDWSVIDPLIIKHLPSMTCVDFCKKFPYTTAKATSMRAKKIGVRFAPKIISSEHRQAVSKAVSKYKSNETIDQMIKDSYETVSIQSMAASIGWSHYAIKKRMTELGLKQSKRIIDGGSKLFKQPKSNRINWKKFDYLIYKHLPLMTIRDFQTKYIPEASDKAVGARAMKLGVSFAPYKLDDEHKAKLSELIQIYKWTPEQDQLIISNKDNLGQAEIANKLSVSIMAILRRMRELGIKRSDESLHNVRSINSIATLDIRLKASKEFLIE